MEVSVRELKIHLSKYLRAARQGEPIVITSHSRPVARIEPVRIPVGGDAAERLASAVGVDWAGGKPTGAAIRLEPGVGTASEAVLEDRR